MTGDHCEKCDTQNHYFGNPMNESCYYDLAIDYQYTFIDFGPTLTDGTTYHAYSYLCIQQGTLKRDDCSPVQIDTFTLSLSPPPPSPPPPAA